MTSQNEHATAFHALHKKGDPVVLFNIWDAGSAKCVAQAGAKAIATGSAPVAMANGYRDGEKIPLDEALANVRRIVGAVDVPVTMDIEGAYGAEPAKVADTITLALGSGVVGFNFEDQIVGSEDLYDPQAQSERITAVSKACSDANIDAFINARTDIFLKAKPETHSPEMLDAAITRAKAYELSGASGFFAPGLIDEKFIGQLCESIALPVNIIALPGAPENARLADLGVARISYGPVPYLRMLKWLTEQAAAVL